MAHWDMTTKHWSPGEARLFWWRVSADACKDISKSPPWLLLSGLTASPSVLLTWYWRDKKRRTDERNAEVTHELAKQMAFSGRYTKAAELLAHADEMTRINGLESLWDIAIQSSAHRAAVSRTFAAFVRTRSRQSPTSGAEVSTLDCIESDLLPADVQQAMTLIGRPEWGEWPRTRADLDLRKAKLNNVDLTEARLLDANLEGANLEHAILKGAKLNGANMGNANLERAKLYSANLERANLEGANLERTNLISARLDAANLEGANLERASLEGASLRGAYLGGASLKGGNLAGANLERASLRHANLECAKLQAANLEGANLECANLEAANLEGANLEGATLEGATMYIERASDPSEPTSV